MWKIGVQSKLFTRAARSNLVPRCSDAQDGNLAFQLSHRQSGRISSVLLRQQQTTSFASSTQAHPAEARPDVANVRKQLWEFYLSTGRGANALFEAIDLDEKGTIDPNALKVFMEQVLPEEPQEIMPYAWNRLEQRAAAGQDYDQRGFKKWLVAATKMSADTKNSRVLEYFAKHPFTGERMEAEEDEDNYTWNEETMSQSLRRMQVR